jgi:hypothetical protein
MNNPTVQEQPQQVLKPRLEELFARIDPVRGRLIFAIDATGSREKTWDLATKLQADMFAAVGAIGGLDVQLVYFRGLYEFTAGNWINDPRALTALMQKITCDTGPTQIEKVRRRARPAGFLKTHW